MAVLVVRDLASHESVVLRDHHFHLLLAWYRPRYCYECTLVFRVCRVKPCLADIDGILFGLNDYEVVAILVELRVQSKELELVLHCSSHLYGDGCGRDHHPHALDLHLFHAVREQLPVCE